MANTKTYLVLLLVLSVTSACASSPEDSTEVDGGVATTGDGGNFRLLRVRDMANVREENARFREAKRAAAEAEAKAKTEAGQADEDAAAKDEKPEDDDGGKAD